MDNGQASFDTNSTPLGQEGSSRRAVMLVSLLVVALGIAVLAIVFVWKPFVETPQVSVERIRYPIERQQAPAVATSAVETRAEEREARVPEVEAEGLEVKMEEPTIKTEQPEIKVEEPRISAVDKPESQATPTVDVPTGGYSVNVASCKQRANAEALVRELKNRGYRAAMVEATIPGRGTWYRVSMGQFPSENEAQAAARAFKEKEGMDCFLTPID